MAEISKMKLEDWLDDICVRFIINLPQEELDSVERICFQIEEAQWFYEDFVRPLDPALPSLSLRNFCLRIFQHCPLLSRFTPYQHSQAFDTFLLYKTRVPVRGAILLNDNMDKVVLVKGWKKNACWSFPRGKINDQEADIDCAIREVYEETGYDIKEARLIVDEDNIKSIEFSMREQHMRLYVFRGVPLDAHFEAKTRKEISKIQWYNLSDLPTLKRNKQRQEGNGEDLATNATKFYMVAPFLGPLKKWISQQSKLDVVKGDYDAHLAPTAVTDTHAQTTAPTIAPVQLDAELPDHNYSTLPADATEVPDTRSTKLKELLNVKQYPAEMQESHLPAPAPQSAAAKSSALLSLLRNGTSVQNPENGLKGPLPRTPLDQIQAQPMPPRSPPHKHPQPQPQPFSTLAPPPTFNANPAQNFPRLSQEQNGYPSPFQHHFSQPAVSSAAYSGPPANVPQPSFQSPFQDDSFRQGSVLGSQLERHNNPAPYHQTGDPEFAQQFPTAQAPTVPRASQLPAIKLSKHAQSLLDAFRTGAVNPPPTNENVIPPVPQNNANANVNTMRSNQFISQYGPAVAMGLNRPNVNMYPQQPVQVSSYPPASSTAAWTNQNRQTAGYQHQPAMPPNSHAESLFKPTSNSPTGSFPTQGAFDSWLGETETGEWQRNPSLGRHAPGPSELDGATKRTGTGHDPSYNLPARPPATVAPQSKHQADLLNLFRGPSISPQEPHAPTLNLGQMPQSNPVELSARTPEQSFKPPQPSHADTNRMAAALSSPKRQKQAPHQRRAEKAPARENIPTEQPRAILTRPQSYAAAAGAGSNSQNRPRPPNPRENTGDSEQPPEMKASLNAPFDATPNLAIRPARLVNTSQKRSGPGQPVANQQKSRNTAISILPRPATVVALSKDVNVGHGRHTISGSGRQRRGQAHSPAPAPSPSPKVESKPFQPQILRRPNANGNGNANPSTAQQTATSPKQAKPPNPSPVPPSTVPISIARRESQPQPQPPSFDRRDSVPAEQKQTLLSLLNRNNASTPKASPIPPVANTAPVIEAVSAPATIPASAPTMAPQGPDMVSPLSASWINVMKPESRPESVSRSSSQNQSHIQMRSQESVSNMGQSQWSMLGNSRQSPSSTPVPAATNANVQNFAQNQAHRRNISNEQWSTLGLHRQSPSPAPALKESYHHLPHRRSIPNALSAHGIAPTRQPTNPPPALTASQLNQMPSVTTAGFFGGFRRGSTQVQANTAPTPAPASTTGTTTATDKSYLLKYLENI
ncbi:MAG: mRNA-decapping enzyme subunit 2 [Cirrosporium novae-zelandiae]|nr:MAG: mRNA-decapping enzyme subunit 2 [Cirrosporium novae-zelandiae]